MPGVRVVVDAGLSRVPRADLSRGLGSLVTVRASRAAVTQRAGRAGREGPGAVYRCWTAAEHDRLPAHDEPEVAIADLTAFALELACWGAPGGRGLALLDPPPEAALAVAEQTLRGLGAVDDEGRATARGRALTAVGVHPRLARALLDGAPLVGRRRAAEVVALLSGDTSFRSDDLGAAWRSLRDGADRGATARWREEVARLERAAADAAAPRLPDDTAAGLVVGLAHPERLARRRPGSTGTYLMAAGTGAELAPGTALTGAPWLAIAVADRSPGRRDARVRLGRRDRRGDRPGGRRRAAPGARRGDLARRRRVQRPGGAAGRDRAGRAAAARSGPGRRGRRRRRGPAPRGARAAALDAGRARSCAPGWRRRTPDSAIRGRPSTTTPCSPRSTCRAPAAGPTSPAWTSSRPCVRCVPWQLAGELDAVVPERVEVPTGSRIRVDYSDPDVPTLLGAGAGGVRLGAGAAGRRASAAAAAALPRPAGRRHDRGPRRVLGHRLSRRPQRAARPLPPPPVAGGPGSGIRHEAGPAAPLTLRAFPAPARIGR